MLLDEALQEVTSELGGLSDDVVQHVMRTEFNVGDQSLQSVDMHTLSRIQWLIQAHLSTETYIHTYTDICMSFCDARVSVGVFVSVYQYHLHA